MSTLAVPYRVNQSFALLTSLRMTAGITSAALWMRCSPTHREMPYNAHAPRSEPTVAQMIASTRLSVPREAVKLTPDS